MFRLGIDKVMFVLTTASLLSLILLDFVSLQPNRILPGTGHSIVSSVGWGYALLIILPLLFNLFLSFSFRKASSIQRYSFQLLMLILVFLFMPMLLAIFATQHISETQIHARTGLGSAFWVLLFLTSLSLIELKQKLNLSRLKICFLIILITFSWLFFYITAQLDTLAIVREYTARSVQFQQAFRVHLYLVCAAVMSSIVLSTLLVMLMRRHHVFEKAIFPLLNFIQTIPSLALFGLLIAPLGYLAANSEWLQSINVGGIGWAPAMIALIAYSLLPMVRNTYVALNEVDASVIDAAKGMGMSPLEVFLQVRLPLAMPIILEGIRITTIQAIGLTAVAALIGAGGLGNFIFQGLGQAAMDMVLLGALPILFMALMADLFFSTLMSLFSHQDKTSRESQ